ncbi:MAG TPA: retroviral-like aspartic protease family protein [bacterium]
MRTSAKFDSSETIIYVGAEIHGPQGSIIASLALDTGASNTIVSCDIIRAVGYDPASGTEVRIVTGSATPTARELVIERLDSIGQSVHELRVICHDLPEESGLDGLLGLNFLRHFDTEINYSNGTLVLKPLHLS